MKKEYYLKNIIAFNPRWAYLLALPFALFWAAVYYWLLGTNFHRSFLVLFSLACLASMYGLMRMLVVNLTLKFDTDCFYIIKENGQIRTCRKTDVLGFYSYSYAGINHQKSALRLEIHLVNGEKVYMDSIDPMDIHLLTQFLENLQRELNCEITKRGKFKKRYWYAVK